jgi:hypothetical protein
MYVLQLEIRIYAISDHTLLWGLTDVEEGTSVCDLALCCVFANNIDLLGHPFNRGEKQKELVEV